MDKETWKKGEDLIKNIPKLKTDCGIRWSERGARENFILLCELLKGNAIPTKDLDLVCDEEERNGKGGKR